MSLLAASINSPAIVASGLTGPTYHAQRGSCIRAVCRMIAVGLAVIAVIASPSVTSAQGAPPSGACSEEVRQALMAVGSWAEAQCASRDSFAVELMLPTVQHCTTEVADGLRRIGGWAEAQCQA